MVAQRDYIEGTGHDCGVASICERHANWGEGWHTAGHPRTVFLKTPGKKVRVSCGRDDVRAGLSYPAKPNKNIVCNRCRGDYILANKHLRHERYGCSFVCSVESIAKNNRRQVVHLSRGAAPVLHCSTAFHILISALLMDAGEPSACCCCCCCC
jgi:hypothetical protein